MQTKKILIIFSFLFSIGLYAQNVQGGLPKPIQVALLNKVLPLWTGSSPQLRIYVVGKDDDLLSNLEKVIGGKIIKVDAGMSVPANDPKPDVLFVVDAVKIDEVKEYTRRYRKLSVTSDPDFVKKGITLGLIQSNDKPRIFLNEAASKAENITWNPAFINADYVIHHK